jgi:uncharacterized protein YidB (DUF937 family)
MGLLDVLNGMQNGPHGPSHPSTESNGGMSPMTMAILALLGWKALKHFTQPSGATTQTPSMPSTPPASPAGGSTGGSPGNILTSGLGGLLAGGAAGSILSGGLGDILKQLQQGGQGEAADSWVGKGPNKPVAPKDLASALGADQIDQIATQSGMSRDDLLSGLSQYLPKVIDHLTPDGRLPNEREVSGRL